MRVNVLQGRQSINCENSVFPAFMGRPSLEKGRANRHQLQTDTTQNRRKTVICQMLRSDSFGKLRTVVYSQPSKLAITGEQALELMRREVNENSWLTHFPIGLVLVAALKKTFHAHPVPTRDTQS